jgi:hypothetical protein
MSQDAPSNASELVGERDGKDVVMQPLLGRLEPRLEAMALPAPGLDQYNPCGLNEQNAQVAIAAFRYPAEDRAVPGRDLLGDESQPGGEVAAFVNASPAPIAATVALEMIGPIPGTLINRSQPASRRARTSISLDKLSIRSSSRRQSPARSSMTRRMRGDRASQGVARMRGNSARKKRKP